MRILATEAECVEASSPEPSNWQRSLRQAVRSGRELLEMLGLPQNHANLAAEADFPVFAPREFIAKIKPGDPADPLLRQVLAHADETDGRWEPGLPDPVGDLPATRMPGLIQKYSGRALLITTGVAPSIVDIVSVAISPTNRLPKASKAGGQPSRRFGATRPYPKSSSAEVTLWR